MNEVYDNDGRFLYNEFVLGDKILREFTQDSDDDAMVWHTDELDRKVWVINNEGWKFQFDNELPQDLIVGQCIDIPKDVYHRPIKGEGILCILIIESNRKITHLDNPSLN